MDPIEALAPGKVVLWGEYAVLAGAPALVMAVDRYAGCTIGSGAHKSFHPARPQDRTGADRLGWLFSSRGYPAEPALLSRAVLLSAAPPPTDSPAWSAWHVLRSVQTQTLPEAAEVVIDTTGFYEGGVKLGLGSSAAVCVALYGAFCELLRRPARFAEVAAIHHRLQGNQGSGIDVAAAWYGGLIRFERNPEPGATPRPSVTRAALPQGLMITFLWAGHPAATTAHLQRFAAWRERGRTDELDALMESSRHLFDSGDCIAALRQYVGCLEDLDRAAQLTIYDAAHRELHRLAARCGVVYKPCGAGGGDIGAAFSYEAGAIERFTASARAAGFAPITLETAQHGILVRR